MYTYIFCVHDICIHFLRKWYIRIYDVFFISRKNWAVLKEITYPLLFLSPLCPPPPPYPPCLCPPFFLSFLSSRPPHPLLPCRPVQQTHTHAPTNHTHQYTHTQIYTRTHARTHMGKHLDMGERNIHKKTFPPSLQHLP